MKRQCLIGHNILFFHGLTCNEENRGTLQTLVSPSCMKNSTTIRFCYSTPKIFPDLTLGPPQKDLFHLPSLLYHAAYTNSGMSHNFLWRHVKSMCLPQTGQRQIKEQIRTSPAESRSFRDWLRGVGDSEQRRHWRSCPRDVSWYSRCCPWSPVLSQHFVCCLPSPKNVCNSGEGGQERS